jgi:two-component system, chemotaxis family, sensor kinase CheA
VLFQEEGGDGALNKPMLTKNDAELLVNKLASDLLLAASDDLAPLARMLDGLAEIAAVPGMPSALTTQAQRLSELVNNIIMGETPFDNGCKKLSQGLQKMGNGLQSSAISEKPPQQNHERPAPLPEEPDPAPTIETAEDVPADCLDLLVKFASSQQNVLEDFEAGVLEWEKGNPAAADAIRRILHTWKGEFGVLNLRTYSGLMHECEDRMEKKSLSMDDLFKVKDFLSTRFNLLANKMAPAVSENDKARLFAKAVSVKAPSSVDAGEAAGQSSDHPAPAAIRSTVTPEAALAEIMASDRAHVGEFIQEARDHLTVAEEKLLELEAGPKNGESIDAIFRAWHTIKGVAGFMGLNTLKDFAHAMESIMDQVRKAKRDLDPPCIDLLLSANDCLKGFISALEQAATGQEATLPANLPELLDKLHIMESAPIAPGQKKIGELLVEENAVPATEVVQALAQQTQGDSRKLGEILVQDHNVPEEKIAEALTRQNSARPGAGLEETIRVPINRIDQLVDTIGEAVIAQSMIYGHESIRNSADVGLRTKVEHGAMIMRSIQEMAMSLRMVSIKSTFQKMARLARDLAKKFGREVDFVTEGEDTELDKSVVEKIGDPLIHMIRNSMDHGIEQPADRIAAGKPAKGMLKLKAFHRAGSIFIEVADDGKGLDKEAIVKKAVSRELCKEGQSLTDQEIYQFIFLPGFSTAKQVTDVSGRGVGMDVVKRNIDALRGSVEILTSVGKGTTFSIRLPLTLAIVDGMIVRSENDTYIIPTLAIVESLKPEKDQIATVMHRASMLKVRGELFPVVNLRSIFNGGNKQWSADTGVVMIVEDMLGKKIGIHVDEIVGQQQVVVKSLGDGVGDVPGITGGAIMNDGNVSLIIDVGGIIKMAGG